MTLRGEGIFVSGHQPLQPLAVVDHRNERWRAAEERYARTGAAKDLAIVTEEQAAFDAAHPPEVFEGLDALGEFLRKLGYAVRFGAPVMQRLMRHHVLMAKWQAHLESR